jgi:hypothetical protein
MSCTDVDLANFSSWASQKDAAIRTATAAELATHKTQIDTYIGCLNSKLDTIRSSSTTASTDMEYILALEKRVKEREEEVLIAKDRARIAREGTGNPSYYESWFPLGRPMKPITVYIFLALSVFFLLIALFYGLSMLGITFAVLFPSPKFKSSYDQGFFGRLMTWFPPSFWVLLVLSSAVIYYLFKMWKAPAKKDSANSTSS